MSAVLDYTQSWPRRCLDRLKRFDPGFKQTILACHSTIALIFTMLCLLRWSPLLGYVFAGVATVLVSLSTSGGTRKARYSSQLIAGAGFIVAVALGYFLKPDGVIAVIGLLLMTLAAFYSQRLGERYLLFPPNMVVFYVLAIGIPLPMPLSDLTWVVLAMLIGMLWSIVCFALMNHHTASRRALRHFGAFALVDFDALFASMCKDLALNQCRHEFYMKKIKAIRVELQSVLSGRGVVQLKLYQPEWFDDFWLKLYALLKIQSMITDNIAEIYAQSATVNEIQRLFLIKQLAQLQTSLKLIAEHYLKLKTDTPLMPIERTVPKLPLSQSDKASCHQLYWLNILFGISRSQELLQELVTLLNDHEARWQ